MMGSHSSKLYPQSNGESPLQIVGITNAYIALMAEKVGFAALYLSGAGVANSCYGLPDLAMTTLTEVVAEVRKITSCSLLPLLVDIDTGWGSSLMIQRTIVEMEKAGAAAVHIEDQQADKRCGHLPGKKLVSKQLMVDRIKAAVDARTNPDFQIMARTDAAATEGVHSAIERSIAYIEAGADLLFPEALTSLEAYGAYKAAVGAPVLANMTEFGNTPLLTCEELHSADIDMVLYPLSIFRSMNFAALSALKAIKKEGSQKSLIHHMQTREELYAFLRYDQFERISHK